MFSLYTIGFSEKYGRSDKLVDQCLDMAGETILDSLTALMIEVHQRKGKISRGKWLGGFPGPWLAVHVADGAREYLLA